MQVLLRYKVNRPYHLHLNSSDATRLHPARYQVASLVIKGKSPYFNEIQVGEILLLFSQLDRSYRTRMVEVLPFLLHRWSLVHVWALWCLPASTASGFRCPTSDVAKKRPKLWVRLEMGWWWLMFDECFPATRATLQQEWMIRSWVAAGVGK